MDVPNSCDTGGICCLVLNYRGNVDNWQIYVFYAVMVSIALSSVLFLMFRMQKSIHSYLPIYPQIIQITCLSFFIVIICYIVGEPANHPTVFEILYIVVTSSEWWVQVAIVIFMFQKDTEKECVLRTVRITTLLVIMLIIVPVISVFLDKEWIGVVLTEALLSLGFLTVYLLRQLPFQALQRLAARPAATRWSIFMCLAHTLFLCNYVLILRNPSAEPGKCLSVISDVIYYSFYAPLLWITLTSDSNYWRERGALLRVRTNIPSPNANLFSQDDTIRKIPLCDIVGLKMIGIGSFAEVYKGESILGV